MQSVAWRFGFEEVVTRIEALAVDGEAVLAGAHRHMGAVADLAFQNQFGQRIL